MAESLEKNPMTLINELAHFNKIQHSCTEIDGSARKKISVKLMVGDEEYFGSGRDFKKARVAAAAVAVRETKYPHPPANQPQRNPSFSHSKPDSPAKQSRLHPPVNQLNHNPPATQSKSRPNPPVNQSKSKPLLSQVKPHPPDNQLRLQPPVIRSKPNPPLTQSKHNPTVRQSESQPPKHPVKAQPTSQSTEAQSLVKQSKHCGRSSGFDAAGKDKQYHNQQSQQREQHHHHHHYPQRQQQWQQQQNQQLHTMTQSFHQLQRQQTSKAIKPLGYQPQARQTHVEQQYYGRNRNQRQHQTNSGHYNHRQQHQMQPIQKTHHSKTASKKDGSPMKGLTGVVQVTSQPILDQIQHKCLAMAGWTKWYQVFPGSWPVTMDVKSMKFLTEKPYKVSWKADGTRYMMLVDGKDKVFLMDRSMNVFHVSNLNFYKREDFDACIADTLLDGEHIIEKVGGQYVSKYLVYDVIKFQGVDIGNFDQRLQCIAREIIGPRQSKMEHGTLDRLREPFCVCSKQFFDITRAHELLQVDFVKSMGHKVDGLIFQPLDDPYTCGNSYNVLKWKPPSQNTVDFRLQIQFHLRGNQETTGLLLAVAQRKPPSFDYEEIPFAEIKVTRGLRKYNNRIIECTFDKRQQTWRFMRERVDKNNPNGYLTAMRIWESIINPVTKEMLLDVIATQQWQPDAPRHTSQSPLRTG